MLLINDCFMTHTFTPKIQEFLAMLKQKAASRKTCPRQAFRKPAWMNYTVFCRHWNSNGIWLGKKVSSANQGMGTDRRSGN